MSRYNNSKNTAPSLESMKMLEHAVPRSAFDLSKVKDFTGQIGAIMPVDLIETKINSNYRCHYSILSILRNPLAGRLMSGMRIFLHAFYTRKSDLWEGYPEHVTGGVRGDLNLEVPKILLRDNNHFDDETSVTQNDYATPCSLADYLGIPITSVDPNKTDKNTWFTRLVIKESKSAQDKDYKNNVNFLDSVSAPALPSGGFCANALPFVFYQQICQSNFFATDLLLKNKKWFPDFGSRFKLPGILPQYEYDAVNKTFTSHPANGYVNVLDFESPTWSKGSLDQLDWSADGSVYVPLDDDNVTKSGSSIKNKEVPPILTALHFRQFRGDYFNTALPYPDLIRGDIPTITDIANIDFTNALVSSSGDKLVENYGSGYNYRANLLLGLVNEPKEGITDYKLAELVSDQLVNTSDHKLNVGAVSTGTWYDGNQNKIKVSSPSALKSALDKVKVSATFTRNQLNQMLVATAMKERMARTDGSYNQIMESMFNYNPKLHDGKPQYLGGAYMDLTLSDVVQTSQSDTTPLGTAVSRGLAMGDLNFSCFSPDNGYIMVVAEVVPDVYYCNQGIDKLWTRTLKDDVYFPLNDNLGPEPILNKELMMSRTSTENNDIFAWTERNSWMRSRRNSLGGLFALPESLAQVDAPLHMKRRFIEVPKLNNQFVTMSPSNIDMSVFIDENDLPFNFSVVCDVESVEPMSSTSMPNTLGLKY